MINIANIDLRLLRVFKVVVECEGFSSAQSELNISQSTISNHMLALEERLQCKLCNRGRSGFSITEEGRIVYEAAVKLFESIDDFCGSAESLHGRLAGELRIGIVDNTVTDPRAPLANALGRFSARPNNVHVKIVVDSPPALQRHLMDKKIDLAIFGFAQKLPGLRYQNLYIEASGLYCGRHHPLFSAPTDLITIEGLKNHAVVSRTYWFNQDLDRINVPKAAASVEHMEAQLTLILSGAYLGFLPVHYAEYWVERGDLRPILQDDISYGVRFQLVTRKGSKLTPTVTAFIRDVYAAIGTTERPKVHAQKAPQLCTWQARRLAQRAKATDDLMA